MDKTKVKKKTAKVDEIDIHIIIHREVIMIQKTQKKENLIEFQKNIEFLLLLRRIIVVKITVKVGAQKNIEFLLLLLPSFLQVSFLNLSLALSRSIDQLE